MEPASFTSEPQYQRPDERNDMIHYIPRPVITQQAPVVQPVPVPVVTEVGCYHYLVPNMAHSLLNLVEIHGFSIV